MIWATQIGNLFCVWLIDMEKIAFHFPITYVCWGQFQLLAPFKKIILLYEDKYKQQNALLESQMVITFNYGYSNK